MQQKRVWKKQHNYRGVFWHVRGAGESKLNMQIIIIVHREKASYVALRRDNVTFLYFACMEFT